MRRTLGFLIIGGSIFFAREIFAQEVVGSMRVFMSKAIEHPSGTAQGVMVGPIAERFTQQFGVATPLLVDARVVKSFSDDCKRLSIQFTKRAVPTPHGPQDVQTAMELNVCSNGLPPSAGMDIYEIGRVFRPKDGGGGE